MSSRISDDYIITNFASAGDDHTAKVGLVDVAAVKATATFTFSGKPNETSHITITNAAGTGKTFEIDGDNDGVGPGKIAVNGITGAGGGAAGTAADLVAKINAQSGFGITATNPSSGRVVLEQDTGGTTGNTAISLDNSVHWNSVTSVNVPSNFSGGVDEVLKYDQPASGAMPNRIGIKGAPNIRLQSTTGFYQTFIGEQKQ